MGVRHLSGTPWHKERVHRQEGDERRYKGRCRFYEYKDNWCKMRIGQCVGSAHCERYEAVSEEEFRHRQSALQRHKKNQPTKDDECYWY